MDKHNFEIIDEVVSRDIRFHFPGNPKPLTFEEYKQFAHSIYAAFPDFRHTIEDLIAEGDKVVVRATDSGTHKGKFMGLEPTDKECTYGVIAIFRFENGKCVESWEEVDSLGFWQQLGAVPPLGEG
jgi:predicted ester cyclase